MRVSELIKKLKEYDPNMTVEVMVNHEPSAMNYGMGKDCTYSDIDEVVYEQGVLVLKGED